MKLKIKILVCLALIVCVTKSIGGDVVAEQRKNELAAALQALQEQQQGDSHIERPGWYKPEVREKLRDIVKFDGPEPLKRQIAEDVEKTRSILLGNLEKK